MRSRDRLTADLEQGVLLPDFRLNKISDMARGLKAILNPEDQAEDPKNASQRVSERRKTNLKRREFVRAQREKIRSKKRELSQIKKEAGAATDRAEAIKHKTRKKRVQQEIFELEKELSAVKERRAAGEEPVTGALPDFAVIGVMKGGTSFFYHLLTQHPLIEPCAKKELHYFDLVCKEESVEWYRRCFPAPRWEDGRRTITGEATPYLSHPLAAERMARVVPEARLIALLRNPIDRAYSDYQQVVRKGRETRTFEEAIETELGRPLGREDEGFEDQERSPDFDVPIHGYLYKSVYVNHLLRWGQFFPREQMLVLKSEDFFEHPQETLKAAFDFLDLPEWEPQTSEPRAKRDNDRYKRNKRNKGTYEQRMDPVMRRRLEEYFEPHNRRLYDYLGKDFGW